MLKNLYPSSATVLFASILTASLAGSFADSVPAAAQEDIFRRTSLDAVVHWEDATVRMPIDPELEDRFGPGVRAMLAEAIGAWDLGGAIPRFELAHNATDIDRQAARNETGNWIGFPDEWTFGDKLAVTVSTFDAATGAVLSAQVWINPNRKFEMMADGEIDPATDSYDLQAVVTHELGHVLGLGEADHAPDATMYPTFQRGETRQRTLSAVDEDAVDALYAQMSASEPAAQCSSSMPGSSRAAAWPLALLVLAGLIPRRRHH